MPEHAAHHEPHHTASHSPAKAQAVGMAQGPVCGMLVDPAATTQRVELGGRTFHFCSAACRETFIAGPERYLAPAP